MKSIGWMVFKHSSGTVEDCQWQNWFSLMRGQANHCSTLPSMWQALKNWHHHNKWDIAMELFWVLNHPSQSTGMLPVCHIKSRCKSTTIWISNSNLREGKGIASMNNTCLIFFKMMMISFQVSVAPVCKHEGDPKCLCMSDWHHSCCHLACTFVPVAPLFQFQHIVSPNTKFLSAQWHPQVWEQTLHKTNWQPMTKAWNQSQFFLALIFLDCGVFSGCPIWLPINLTMHFLMFQFEITFIAWIWGNWLQEKPTTLLSQTAKGFLAHPSS